MVGDTSEAIGKKRLKNALFSLLDEKTLGKITVGDICERAGVSRQTFYRHYDSKFDIVKEHLYAIAERSMYRVGRDMTWHDSFVAAMDIVLESEDDRMINDEVRTIAYRCRVESLEKTIAEYLGMELTDELAFQIRFFALAEASILCGRPAMPGLFIPSSLSSEELANMLETCVPKELHDLLDVSGRS